MLIDFSSMARNAEENWTKTYFELETQNLVRFASHNTALKIRTFIMFTLGNFIIYAGI